MGRRAFEKKAEHTDLAVAGRATEAVDASGTGAVPKDSRSAARDCSIESLRSPEGDAWCVAATPLARAARTLDRAAWTHDRFPAPSNFQARPLADCIQIAGSL